MKPTFMIVVAAAAQPRCIALSLVDVRSRRCLATSEAASVEELEGRLPDLVEALFAGASAGPGSYVDLLLCPPAVQIRTLRGLPPVRERDLTSLVTAQAERFFRLARGDQVIAARWRKLSGEPSVAIAASAPLQLLETLEAAVVRDGRRVAALWAAREPKDESRCRLRLLTPSLRTGLRRMKRRHVGAVAALVLAGWTVPAVAYVLDLVRDDAALQAQLTRIDTTLSRVDSLQSRLAEFTPVANMLLLQRADSGWATRALADIANKLPPAVHLHGMSIARDGQVRLDAHSQQTTDDVARAVQAAWGSRARVLNDLTSPDRLTIELEGGP